MAANPIDPETGGAHFPPLHNPWGENVGIRFVVAQDGTSTTARIRVPINESVTTTTQVEFVDATDPRFGSVSSDQITRLKSYYLLEQLFLMEAIAHDVQSLRDVIPVGRQVNQLALVLESIQTARKNFGSLTASRLYPPPTFGEYDVAAPKT